MNPARHVLVGLKPIIAVHVKINSIYLLLIAIVIQEFVLLTVLINTLKTSKIGYVNNVLTDAILARMQKHVIVVIQKLLCIKISVLSIVLIII